MKTFEHTITDPQGFHARPVVLVASEAGKWTCDITVAARRAGEDAAGSSVPARDPLALLDGVDECEAEQGMRLACTF